jgi:hypothetical protein
MATWKKVIVSGSDASLGSVTTSGNITATGSLAANSSVNFLGLTNASQATIVGIDATTGQLYYQSTGSIIADSASYAVSASSAISASYAATASSANSFIVRNQIGIGTAPVGSYPLYISSSANDESVGIDSSAAINALYLLKNGDKKFEISFDTSNPDGIFRLLPYTGSSFFEIGNPSNAGADYIFVSEKTYGNVLLGPGIGNGTIGLGGSVSSDKVQVKGDLYVSGSNKVLGGLTVKGLTSVSSSYLVGYDPTTGAMSYTGTGSVVSLTSSFAVSASHADNADNAISASYASIAASAQSGNGTFSGSFSGSFQGDGSALTGIASTLTVSGSAGEGIINLKTGNLKVLGTANEIDTAVSLNPGSDGYTVTIGLPDNVTIAQNLTVSGDLIVAGTASFNNQTSLEIADRFIIVASGSTNLTDGGLIVAAGGVGHNISGSAFYLESAATGSVGRFAVAANVHASASAVTPDEYMVSAKLSAASTPSAPPSWGGSTNGSGNIWIKQDTGDIYIWA